MQEKTNHYINTLSGPVSLEDALTQYKYVLPNEHFHSNLS